jgi:hypothetical protein
MARMPSFEEIREDFARGVRTAEQHIEHPFRHDAAPAASQTPAPGPVTLAAAPPKESTDMSLSADLHAFAARIENLGDEAVTDLERVQANPETARVFTALRDLTGLNVAPGIIGIVAAGLGELVTQLKGAVPAGSAPAGPSVAGQA